VTGPLLDAKAAIEKYLGCSLGRAPIAGLSFSADCLDQPNPAAQSRADGAARLDVPDSSDFSACVRELIRLGLMEQRPQIDWVSRRLGLSRRSLQRKLGETARTFEDMLRDILIFEATSRLQDKERPLTSIALDLGYSDPAHFSRAFRAWTGMSPSLWRNRATISS
jgi:AraC-like DNA-binding protein